MNKLIVPYSILAVFFFLTLNLFSQNTLDNKASYIKYNLSDGWSLELPASWKVSKEYNNDFNELMEATADNTLKRMNKKRTLGNLDVQLFAVKSLFNEKISLVVSTQKLPNPLSQYALKNLDETEKKYFLSQSRMGVVNSLPSIGYDPSSEIFVELKDFHDFIGSVYEIRDPSSLITKSIAIPNGGNLLRLEFNYKSSGINIWNPLITKIVESVKLP